MTAPKILLMACNWRHAQQIARTAGIPWSHVVYVHGPESIRQLEHGTRGMARRIAPCFEDRVNAREIRDALMTADLFDAPADQVPANAAVPKSTLRT